LNLVSPWSNKFYQITTKRCYNNISLTFSQLNTPYMDKFKGFGISIRLVSIFLRYLIPIWHTHASSTYRPLHLSSFDLARCGRLLTLYTYLVLGNYDRQCRTLPCRSSGSSTPASYSLSYVLVYVARPVRSRRTTMHEVTTLLPPEHQNLCTTTSST
jgi:hypothetical protein